MNNENIKRLAQKLEEMAKRGTEHERIVAEKKLYELCKKHGITMDQIDSDLPKMTEFSYKTEYQKKLIIQVIAHVAGDIDLYKLGKSKNVYAEVTALQRIEIEAMSDFYYTKLLEDLNLCYQAFIQVNKLFPSGPVNKNRLHNYDRQQIEKVSRMMEGMNQHHYRKQLEEGTTPLS